MTPFNETWILSAELELTACFNLQPLLEHLREHTGVVRHSTHGETHTVWLHLVPSETNLDDALARYAARIEALPPTMRSLWDACTDRCINTGVQAGLTPHAVPVRISQAVLAQVARIGVRLEFTVYAVDLMGPPDPAA